MKQIFAKHDDLGVNLPLDKPGLPAALMVAGHGASATALVPVCGRQWDVECLCWGAGG